MDIQRISVDVRRAQQRFALVELHPTGDGGVFVKAGIQTSVRTYILWVQFTNYPSQMPKVFVTAPALIPSHPHRYSEGNICYLHPSMWNPGKHDLEFTLARASKWLNKYDVWCATGRWPGAQMVH